MELRQDEPLQQKQMLQQKDQTIQQQQDLIDTLSKALRENEAARVARA